MVFLLAWLLLGIALSVVACLLAEMQVKPELAEKVCDSEKHGNFDMWDDDSVDDYGAISTDDDEQIVQPPVQAFAQSSSFFKHPPPGWMFSSSAFDVHHVGHGHGRAEPFVISDQRLLDKEAVLIPAHYKEDVEGVLIPRGLIRDRIERLAADIRKFYGPNEPVHIVCVLKGSRGFFGELVRVLNAMRLFSSDSGSEPPFFEYYVRLKKDPNHPGHVHAISDDLSPLIGKHVLVVEDMINTGLTLSRFCRQLLDMKVKSVRVAALMEKRRPSSLAPASAKKPFKADFVGFSVPDRFIVGFCLDHNEKYRDLQHLVVLNEDAKVRE